MCCTRHRGGASSEGTRRTVWPDTFQRTAGKGLLVRAGNTSPRGAAAGSVSAGGSVCLRVAGPPQLIPPRPTTATWSTGQSAHGRPEGVTPGRPSKPGGHTALPASAGPGRQPACLPLRCSHCGLVPPRPQPGGCQARNSARKAGEPAPGLLPGSRQAAPPSAGMEVAMATRRCCHWRRHQLSKSSPTSRRPASSGVNGCPSRPHASFLPAHTATRPSFPEARMGTRQSPRTLSPPPSLPPQ